MIFADRYGIIGAESSKKENSVKNYNFGNYICERREKKGLTQSQLGEKLGVSNKAVSKWENGGAYPSSELMLPLAKELGVSLEELYSVMSDYKAPQTRLGAFIDAAVEKRNIIILIYAALFAVQWTLFLILGNIPDKNTLLFSAPLMAVVGYALFRLAILFMRKNPFSNARVMELLFVLLITVGVVMVGIMSIVEFLISFPNGLTAMSGMGLGITAATLHAYKKRKR